MSNPDIPSCCLTRLAGELPEKLAALRIPGAAIAVHHRGQRFTASAGQANVEAGIDCDDRTIFQIGSITKVFTATLMIKLAEGGHIEIDAPVSRYLPELRIAHQPVPDTLTVRSLLDYSSGMDGDFFADFGPDPTALARYVDACSALGWVHEPGAMRSYNTTAYCIAGRLIEVVCGGSFNDVLAGRLLTPIGMQRFAFYNHDVARFRTAVGHRRQPHAAGFEVARLLRMPHSLGPAGSSLTTTATDLLRFGLLHLRGGVVEDGSRYLGEALVRQMHTASRSVPPGRSELLMGWATLPTDLGPLVAASGRTIEQNSVLILLPGHDFCMAILTNCADGGEQLLFDLGLPLLKECTGATVALPDAPGSLPAKGPVIAADEAAPYLGHFGNSYQLDVTHVEGRLHGVMTMSDLGSDAPIQQRFVLVRIQGERFAAVAEGASVASSVVEFIRPHVSAPVTHASTSGRLFVRREGPAA